jgi:hypothetical protein
LILFTFIFVVLLVKHPLKGLLVICALCYWAYYGMST